MVSFTNVYKQQKRKNAGHQVEKKDGEIVAGRLIKHARSSVQLARTPSGWRFQATRLDEALRKGISTVVIYDDDTGRVYQARLAAFYRYGTRVTCGHIVEICLPLEYWTGTCS